MYSDVWLRRTDQCCGVSSIHSSPVTSTVTHRESGDRSIDFSMSRILCHPLRPVMPSKKMRGSRCPCGTVPDLRPRSRSRVRIPPATAVHQRQLSVPSLRGRLMSTSEKLGSKRAYHAMHEPRIRGLLRLRLVSGWWLRKRRSAPPHGPLRLGKGLYFLLLLILLLKRKVRT